MRCTAGPEEGECEKGVEGDNPGRSPLAPGLGRGMGETGRLTASAGLWVRDTARAGTRGTCCWRSPWAVSGGRAQLHPSAASCPPPSGVKFQPWRHRILGWGPSALPPRPTFQGSPGCSTLWNSVPLTPLRSPEVGEEKLGRAPRSVQRHRHWVFRVWRHLE